MSLDGAQTGRHPAVSSSYKSKYTASSLELTVFWLRGASCVSGPAPRNEEWCRAAANSMRTVIRSCRSHERSRRSLLRRAEPTSRSAMSKPTVKVLTTVFTTKSNANLSEPCVVVVVVVVVVVGCWLLFLLLLFQALLSGACMSTSHENELASRCRVT